MSAERIELERMARAERANLRLHVGRLPARAATTATALVKAHPFWMAGGAAALAVAVMSGLGNKMEVTKRKPRWRTALAAISMRLLPEILRAAGSASSPAAPKEDSPSTAGAHT